MRALPLGISDKPFHKAFGPKGEIGFWLPVGCGPFTEESKGQIDLLIWMEYDPDCDKFLGAVTMGTACHVEAFRIRRRNREWHVADERVDSFLGTMTDGDKPQAFTIKGFSGKWVTVVTPFS